MTPPLLNVTAPVVSAVTAGNRSRWYHRRMDKKQIESTRSGISRSGLILGAAGLAGASALAALPGIATAAPRNTSRRLHPEMQVAVKQHHPHYTRQNFERARSTVVLKDGDGKSMTLRVDDVATLRLAGGATKGSKDWAGGFSVLMTRTKGAKLGNGTFAATANGKTFPLTVSLVGLNTYQAIINRFEAKGG